MPRIPMLFAVLAACLAFTAAHAAALTADQIEGYAASLPAIEKLVEAREAEGALDWDEEGFKPQPGQPWNPMSGVVAEMQGMALYDDFVDILEAHGFDSAEQWGAVGDRVTRAMVAIQMEGERDQIDAEMAEALRQIEESPDLSPDQKAMMRESMQGAYEMIESMADAPPEDIEAVRPHMPALIEVMEAED